jgi:hypothetical protein
VAAGDRVVTDGQLRLAPGATVTIDQPGRPKAPDKAQDKDNKDDKDKKTLEKAPKTKAETDDRRTDRRG